MIKKRIGITLFLGLLLVMAVAFSGCGGALQRLAQPLPAPACAFFFWHRPRAGVVAPHLAQTLRAQVGQAFVKFFATKAEGLQVGAVAQGDHTVFDVTQKLRLSVQ